MSYCEVYMEKVNDLLRKISPQSQNLPVKEDSENGGFYVEGLKEKIVGSAEEVTSLLAQAEKRRRVAYTRYNEVSSRSHTLLMLWVECSSTMEAADAAGAVVAESELPRMTRVGRLTIVDLAGNERMEAGTEYMAESNSINKSLFFLGKVIEKLALRDRRLRSEVGDEDGVGRGDHVPFRDSKLTRLLSVHLGGNSQTGLLVTLTPAEDAVEQSFTTLRFAQKAGQVRCVAKPVLISKEQSLIMKQREIIQQLHSQVKELQEDVQSKEQEKDRLRQQAEALSRQASTPPVENDRERAQREELAAARQERVEELQALTLGAAEANAFVSKSRDVDQVVTTLHRSNDVLRKQKAPRGGTRGEPIP